MPKLTAVAICDKVLHDDDGHPTLIHVFTSIKVSDMAGKPIQPDATVPRPWAIFSMWQAEEGDRGKRLALVCMLTAPDGKSFGKGELPFEMTEASHNSHLRVAKMPVGVEGRIVVRFWLEVDAKRVTDEYETSILVEHESKQE